MAARAREEIVIGDRRMTLRTKMKPLISAEKLRECLGGCAECNWKKGEPEVKMTGTPLNQQPVVRVRCKAVIGENGELAVVKPISAAIDPKDCSRRKRAILRKGRDKEGVVARFATLHISAVVHDQGQFA